MEYGEISKLMIMHLIIAVVIMIMVCFGLSTVKIDNLAYLGVLFGLYVFAGYGVNRLIEEKLIEKKSHKYILVIFSIVVFYLFFTYLMPLFFNMEVFGIVRIGNDLVLDSRLIFAIFSAAVFLISLR